jgi:hypothetical protein
MTTTRLVEFAFSKSSGSYVYQNISAYVRSIDFGRGKSRDLDVYQAGSINVVLDNNTRAFDPQYSGTFSSEVKPAGAIKITINGVVQFQGFISDWSFDYQPGGDATATITGSDLLGTIAAKTLPAISVPPLLAGEQIAYVLAQPSVGINYSARKIQQGVINCQTTSISEGTNALDYLNSVAATDFGELYGDAQGVLQYKDQRQLATAQVVGDVYVNMALNPSFEFGTTNWTNITQVSPGGYFGSAYGATGLFFAGYYTGAYSETDSGKYFTGQSYTLSAYVKVPAGSDTVAMTAYMLNGALASGPAAVNFQTISSASRWVRMNVTVSSNNIVDGIYLRFVSDASIAVDGFMITAGTSLNDYFDGDFATAYGSGYTIYYSWAALQGRSASSARVIWPNTDTPTTVSITDTGSGIQYQNLNIIYGSELLTNKGSITRVGATNTLNQLNQTSIDAYGIYAYSTDSYAASDAEAQEIINLYVASYAQPEYRFESVTINLDALTLAQQNSLLALDIHDALNITYTPSKIGSALVKLHTIIGVSQNIGIDRHDITFNLQLATNQVFTLDSDFFGVLDSNILTY